ncbi:DUF4145 domain-containing protein [Rhizobium sp. ARZ01]|uniref:DUF4145 domain-containing protein n=1 Tax=Rhizobium sp. ARZ01 TaxID=2769313 RepID=UPI001783812B|nr:DUF4145 domain-containing protein [Rhizobium sp. ARZ01]MBD9372780.1 DUF4145 domain-containing protein [Rhizobium sp. ARZ01]
MTAYTGVFSTQNGTEASFKLLGIGRCPHCSVATPNFNKLWSDTWTEMSQVRWASYRCNTCGSVVTARLAWRHPDRLDALNLWPSANMAHEDIPQPARRFLQQAFETLHAPDAAAVMAGSAVDAMLKTHDYVEGSLYSRIDKALKDNLLTKGMADWAHEVRLGSNRPRHADAEKPHVTSEEAKLSVEFAEALGNFLFVLTAKIDRGIAAAKAAEV